LKFYFIKFFIPRDSKNLGQGAMWNLKEMGGNRVSWDRLRESRCDNEKTR
jgi:hypothetical protein